MFFLPISGSEWSPASEDPLRGNASRSMEQFSQERDEEIHGWDDTTGKVVSKVIATPFSGTGGQVPL